MKRKEMKKKKVKIKNVASGSNVGSDAVTQNNKKLSAADMFEQR